MPIEVLVPAKMKYKCDHKDCTRNIVYDRQEMPEGWMMINGELKDREAGSPFMGLLLCPTHAETWTELVGLHTPKTLVARAKLGVQN